MEYLRANTKIYLSGRFGDQTQLTLGKFKYFEDKYPHIIFINPLRINQGIGMVDENFKKTGMYDRSTCFEFDIKAIQQCDGIVAVNNWKTSPGAITELMISANTGKMIFLEEEDCVLKEWNDKVFRYNIKDLINI